MSLAIHIPGWLLWFSGGIIVGAVLMRIFYVAAERAAIGRAFGW